MNDDPALDGVRRALRGSGAAFYDAVDAVRELGEAGEKMVLDCLREAKGDRRAELLDALGAFHGDEGFNVLQEAFSNGTDDDRAAAVTALEQRDGPRAVQQFTDTLTRSKRDDLREFAVFALAKHGDERAWQEVLDWLAEQLKRRTRPETSPCTVGVGLTYLLRHTADERGDRLTAVAALIRGHWTKLTPDEVRRVRRYWPDVDPDGPPVNDITPPNRARLFEWVHTPTLWALDEGLSAP